MLHEQGLMSAVDKKKKTAGSESLSLRSAEIWGRDQRESVISFILELFKDCAVIYFNHYKREREKERERERERESD